MQAIALTQGLHAQVDDDNYLHLSSFNWYAKKSRRTFYAVRNVRIKPGRGGQRQVKMHTEILGDVHHPLQCDHVDGNGLNNTKSNLRIVTPRKNAQNLHVPKSSMYPGVSFSKGRKKPWVAHISVGDVYQKTLGYFTMEIDAYNYYSRVCYEVEKIKSVEDKIKFIKAGVF